MSPSARNPGGPIPLQKPDDKEAPDYKKKQALARGPLLNLYLDNATTYSMPESLFTAMKDIFEAILANPSRTGVIQPTKFLEVLRKENEMFRTSMHQDAHEFLNLLLNEVVANVEANAKQIEADKADKAINGSAGGDSFEKALASAIPTTNGSRPNSNTGWVHDLFEGTLTSETKCLTCENVSQRDEAFLDLSVDLDQHSSVTSCLRKFSEEEMLCERNKFHCDRCGGLQEAEKRMKIKRCPKILALHLKRFKYTEDLQRLQKLFHRVVYPYHLRLFNTTDDAEDPDRLYELYAVVVHIGGGPYHGHYVAIVKTQDRGWLLFDDENVEPVDKSYVRNFFGDRPGLACAYVLFYQETTVEAMKREQEAEGRAAAQAVPASKSHVGLGLKTNGAFMNGLQHVKTAVSPLSEDEDGYDGLDKSATEPPVALRLPPESATPSAATPVTPLVAATTPTKPDAQSKKERAKEEKERKAAEKEQEKAEKLRLKNIGAKKKENEKKEAAELKAAMEASKGTKHAEEPKVAYDAAINGLTGTSTLSRFRPNSKSISRRPKFWSSKDKDFRTSDETTTNGEEASASAPQPPEKAEKSKNRFSSLRKKTSNMML